MKRRIKNKVFNRRTFILGIIQLTISMIFGCRLYFLQIRDKKKYKILSDNNRIRVSSIIPQRGRILDRTGIELGINKILFENSYQEDILQEVGHSLLKSAFYNRYYPFGQICSHILGYTKKQEGFSGIEYIYDKILKGIPGKIEHEVDSKKNIIRELSNLPPKNGQDVHLTIDIYLHKKIDEIFQHYTGSVIVINSKSGEILALYNSPSYDNNVFTHSLSDETWKNLNSNSLPLVNRALSYQIPLGSIFKIIVALTALKDDIITPEKKFLCKGELIIGNRKFRCWKHYGHGYVNLNEAIASSCNTYFYNIGKYINVDSLLEMASKFGLGSGPLMKKFKEEASGLLPNKKWREQNLYSEWQVGDTINLVIGQGYILTTPLQLAILAARIATGKEVYPCITTNEIIQNFTKLNVNHEHLNIIRDAMFNTVNSRIGTAYNKQLPDNISGKTGTPEIGYQGRNHKLFISYDLSGYAISVFLEYGKSPRQDCSIAYEIFNYIHSSLK